MSKINDQVVADIYELAVTAECRKKVDDDAHAAFELECKLEDSGGLATVMRQLIDMSRRPPFENMAIKRIENINLRTPLEVEDMWISRTRYLLAKLGVTLHVI